ncbi:cytochrome b [Paucibacter sp. KBW04]|uniref:cytochrome b n=1 Tax=Paucibacter sp. KBW04 TaxID=2153361 RepID=UPI000F562DF3|nr:cytochrome b/b6 domain-containing protein [Paucibacter sp. KBW04]
MQSSLPTPSSTPSSTPKHSGSELGTPSSYDSRSIRYHWLSAALVLGLWAAGQCIDFFPKGAPRITVRSLHISFGVMLGVMLLLRLLWRRQGGLKLPAAEPGFKGRLALSVHRLLYLLLGGTVLVGMACVWIRGDNLFNLFTVPAFDPSNKALRHDAVELHELFANLLLIFAGLHAAAALAHHWLLKDGVLTRMWPSLGRRPR